MSVKITFFLLFICLIGEMKGRGEKESTRSTNLLCKKIRTELTIKQRFYVRPVYTLSPNLFRFVLRSKILFSHSKGLEDPIPPRGTRDGTRCDALNTFRAVARSTTVAALTAVVVVVLGTAAVVPGVVARGAEDEAEGAATWLIAVPACCCWRRGDVCCDNNSDDDGIV